jgi:hypothetical protein
MWDGWVEFIPRDGGDALRSPRETTQPDRAALEYWAGGLSPTYLEGSLIRAIEPAPRKIAAVVAHPHFDRPAPALVSEVLIAEGGVVRAVLDPFSVGAKGEDLLRRELGALRGWHLRNIIRAYDLADQSLDLERISDPELVELIVQAVQPA